MNFIYLATFMNFTNYKSQTQYIVTLIEINITDFLVKNYWPLLPDLVTLGVGQIKRKSAI